MRLSKLSNYLLATGLLAVIFFFGIMTLYASGGEIVDAAVSGAERDTGTGLFDDIKAGISSIEAEYNLVFYRKFDFVTLNGGMRSLMGKQLFPGTDNDLNMIKLNDGLLAQLKTRLDVEDCRDVLTEVKGFLDERDIPLIFTYAHTKVLEPETQLPLGASDSSNEIADRFFKMLDDIGIDYVDTRKTLLGTGRPLTELYFATDVHWTIPSAYSVFCELAGKLNDQYGFAIDPSATDIDNYDVTTYEDRFLGSDGRRVGVAFAGLDDFTTIIPKFDTQFIAESVNDKGEWERQEGTFQQAVMHMELLECDEGETYSSNCYNAYGYNRGEVLLTNELAQDGRILVIKNSSGIPITDFLALGVHEVCGLDWRVLTGTTIADYIERYQPDAVVIVYNFDFLKPDRLNIFKANPNPGLN